MGLAHCLAELRGLALTRWEHVGNITIQAVYWCESCRRGRGFFSFDVHSPVTLTRSDIQDMFGVLLDRRSEKRVLSLRI